MQVQKGEQRSLELCSCVLCDTAICACELIAVFEQASSIHGVTLSAKTITAIMNAKNFIAAKIMGSDLILVPNDY